MSRRTVFLSHSFLRGAVWCTAVFSVLAVSLVAPQSIANAASGINQQINYQGKLLSSAGAPIADSAQSIKFSLYDAETGGNRLWTASGSLAAPAAVSVGVSNGGLFSVLLGNSDQNTLNSVDWNQTALYLGVTIGSDSEMTPRKRLGAASQAFNSERWDGYKTASSVQSGEHVLRLSQTTADAATSDRTTLILTTSGTSAAFDLLLKGRDQTAGDVFTISRQGHTTTTGNLAVGTNTILGDASADTLVVNASVVSNLVPDQTNVRSLGTTALRWNGFFQNVTSTYADFTYVTSTNVSSTSLYVATVANLPTQTTVGGSAVCLANGANCSQTAGGWTYDLGNDWLRPNTSSVDLVLGGTFATSAPLWFKIDSTSTRFYFGAFGSSTNIVLGGPTSTITNTAFQLDGNDLFVAGNIGSASSVYTNGAYIAGSGTTLYGDGFITKTNGDLVLGATKVTPNANNTIDLGSATNSWANVYASGTVFAAGGSAASPGFRLTSSLNSGLFADTSYLYVATNGATAFSFNSSAGNRSNTSLFPAANNSYDLGSTSLLWATVNAVNVSSTNATTTYLFVSGSASTSQLSVGGYSVCLSSGTNCPTTGSDDWSYSSTNDFVRPNTNTTSLVLGASNATEAPFWFRIDSTSSRMYLGAFGSSTNIVLGASTSSISNTSFQLDGNDLFVAGNIGSASSVYTNGAFISGAGTTLYGDGFITKTNGDLVIGATKITPNANNTIDFGSATNSWANVYASGTVFTQDATVYDDLTVEGNITNILQTGDVLRQVATTTFNAGADPNAVVVSGRYAYVANNGNETMAVVDITNPTSPAQVATTTFTSGSGPYSLFVSGRYVFVANSGNDTLAVVDVSNPGAPIQVATTTLAAGATPFSVFVSGRYAYVANNGNATLATVDVADPTSPVQIATAALTASAAPRSVFVSGRYAYVANFGNSTLAVVDITNPTLPVQVATTTFNGGSNAASVFVSGRYAYVANNGNATLATVDIANPIAPLQVATTTFNAGSGPLSVFVSGRYAYVANNANDTLATVDVGNPTSPVQVATTTLVSGASPYSVFVSGRYAHVANNGNDTLGTIDVHGVETNGLIAHSAEVGSLQVLTNGQVANQFTVGGGLTVGSGGILSSGSLAVSATNTTSTITFAVSSTRGIFSQYVTVNNKAVCLADGTNCPSSGGSDDWSYSSTNDFVRPNTNTTSLVLGASTVANAPFWFKIDSTSSRMYLGAFGSSTNLVLGGPTSTITNTLFQLDGNDLFVAGNIGSASSVYTNGAFISGAGTTFYGDGFITKTNGDLVIGATKITPNANNTMDLGSATRSWANVYASGTVFAVNVSSTNATSSALAVLGLSQLQNVTFTNGTGTTLALTGNFSAGSSTVTTLNFTNATGSALKVTGPLVWTNATGTALGLTSLISTKIVWTNATGTTLALTGNFSAGSSTVTTLNFTNATGSALKVTGPLVWANATGTNLNITGFTSTSRLSVGGYSVCLANGTNCSSSDANWTYDATRGLLVTTTSTQNVQIAGEFSVSTTNPVVTSTVMNDGVFSDPRDIAVSGDYAYVADSKLIVMGISDPTNMKRVGVGADTLSLTDVAAQGTMAYAVGGDYLRVFDVHDPGNPILQGSREVQAGAALKDVAVSGKYAYTVGSGNTALSVIDVSSSTNPQVVGQFASGTLFGGAMSVKIQSRFAYTLASSIFGIVDVSDPTAPTGTGVLYDTTNLASVTDLAVSGQTAYVSSFLGLTILDISSSTRPSVLANLSVPGFFGDVSVAVAGNLAYLTNKGGDQVVVVDVSSSTAPFTVASVTDATNLDGAQAIAVSGRYVFVVLDNTSGNVGVTALKASGITLQAANIGSLSADTLTVGDDLNVGGLFNVRGGVTVNGGGIFSTGPLTITSTATSTVGGLLLAYDRLMVGDGTPVDRLTVNNGNVRIVPATPTFVGSTTTGSPAFELWQGLAIAGKRAYVTAANTNRLIVIDINDPRSPTGVTQVMDATRLDGAKGVDVNGKYAYVAVPGPFSSPALTIVDISTSTPFIVNSITHTNITNPEFVRIQGNYLYVRNNGSRKGILIFDITNPTSPSLIRTIDNSAIFGAGDGDLNFDLDGNYLYTSAVSDAGVERFVVVDISNPYTATTVGSVLIPNEERMGDVRARGSLVYGINVSASGGPFYVFDVKNPAAPLILSSVSLANGSSVGRRLELAGRYAYVAGEGGVGTTVDVVDVSSSTAPIAMGTVEHPTISGTPYEVVMKGKYFYIAGGVTGYLAIADVSGIDAPGAALGSLETDSLWVDGDSKLNGRVEIMEGLHVEGSGIQTSGMLSVAATTTLFANVFVGTTSTANYSMNSAFKPNGDDLFVAGNIGSVSSVYTNGAFVAGSGSTLFGNGFITKTDGSLNIRSSGNLDIRSSTGLINVSSSDDFTLVSGGDASFTVSQSLSMISGDITASTTNGYIILQPSINGYVGIGTSAPSEKLTVVGNIRNVIASGASLEQIRSTSFTSPEDIWVDGDILYVLEEGPPPTLRASKILGETLGLNEGGTVAVGGQPRRLHIADGYAYVVNQTSSSLQVIDIHAPGDLQTVATTSMPDAPRSVYTRGPYAYVAASSRFVVVDVSNPDAPWVVTSSNIGTTVAIDVYVQGRYAYVADFSSQQVKIVDVADPFNPIVTSTITMSGFSPDGIVVQGGFMYLTTQTSNRLRIYDITDPASPVNFDNVVLSSTPEDLRVSGRYAYVAIRGSTDAINVIDISDPSDATLVSTSTAGDETTALFVHGRHLWTAAQGTTDAVVVFDVYGTEVNGLIAHSAELGSLDVRTNVNIHNDLSVGGGINVGIGGIQSNGPISSGGGITASPNLAFLGNVTGTTMVAPEAIQIRGRYLYAVDDGGTGAAGVYVYDVANPKYPSFVASSTIFSVSSINDMVMDNRYLYVFGSNVLEIFDTSRPASTTLISTTSFTGSTASLDVAGRYLYIVDATGNRLRIVDIEDPISPVSATTVTTGEIGNPNIKVQGQYAYVVGHVGNFQIYDVSNPRTNANPLLSDTSTGLTNLTAVEIQGNYAYLVNSITGGEVAIYDISDPTSPQLVGRVTGGMNDPIAIDVAGRYMYVINAIVGGTYDILAYDISSSTAPLLVDTVATPYGFFHPSSFVASGRYLYAGIFDPLTAGIAIFDTGGIDANALNVATLETGDLSVLGNGYFQQAVNLGGSLSVARASIFHDELIIESRASSSVGTLEVRQDCEDDTSVNRKIASFGSFSDLKVSIRCNGQLFADSGTIGSNGDYAEYFISSDPSLGTGDVIAIDVNATTTVTKGSAVLREQTLGVVSEGGVVIGRGGLESHPSSTLVGLLGVLKTKVDLATSVITIGDPVMMGSGGYAVRAHGPGMVLGTALESATSSATTTISVFVRPHWWAGDLFVSNESGSFLVSDLAVASTTTANATSTLVDSPLFSFQGTAWDSASSSAITSSFSLTNDVVSTSTSRFTLLSSATSVSLLTVNQIGDLAIAGKLYPSDSGSMQFNKYIFYDGSPGAGGDRMRTNASGWGTGSYDFAEMFPSNEALEPGDIVVVDLSSPEKIKRSTSANEGRLVGIISTKPGFLAGENNAGDYPVALAGRVPTKVSTENGAIKSGDALVASSQPGVAMRASAPGPSVGVALQDWDGASVTSIVAYVNVTYFVPDGQAIASGGSSVSSQSPRSGLATIKSGDMQVDVTFESLNSYPIIQVTPYGIPVGGFGIHNVTDRGFTIVLLQSQSFDLVLSWTAEPSPSAPVMSFSDGTSVPYNPSTGEPQTPSSPPESPPPPDGGSSGSSTESGTP